MEGAVFLKKKRKKDLKGETPDRSGAGDRVPYREGGGDRGLQGRGGHRGPSQWWQGQGFSLRVEEGASSRWI